MKKRKVPTRHLLAGYAALYGPSTDRKKAEADRLAADYCRRVQRGVPLNPLPADGPQCALFVEGGAGTSRRCPHDKTTPADEARSSRVAGASVIGDSLPGDSSTYSDAA
jgi:hypothetical protein